MTAKVYIPLSLSQVLINGQRVNRPADGLVEASTSGQLQELLMQGCECATPEQGTLSAAQAAAGANGVVGLVGDQLTPAPVLAASVVRALPALVSGAGITNLVFATLGDSIYDIHYNGGVFPMNSVTGHVRRLLGSKVDMPGALNFAVSGATLDGQGATNNIITQQLPLLAAGACDVSLVNIGINSVANMTLAAMLAAYQTIIDTLKPKCSRIVLSCIRMRGSAFPLTGNDLLRANAVNTWLKAKAKADKLVIVYDPNPVLVDYTTGLFKTALTFDGTHHTILGARTEGADFAAFLSSTFNLTDRNTKLTSIGDVYDATHNPGGNMLANGMMATATGGTAPSNGATGTTPLGFRLYRSSAGATYSLAGVGGFDAAESTLPVYTITIGGTGDGGIAIFDAYPDVTSQLNVGDLIYAEAEVELTLSAGFRGYSLGCSLETAAFAVLTSSSDGNVVTSYTLPALTAQKEKLKTEPFVVTAGFKYIKVSLNVTVPASGSVTGTVIVKQIQFRKVITP